MKYAFEMWAGQYSWRNNWNMKDFKWPKKSTDWASGYVCDNIQQHDPFLKNGPDRKIWDGEWRPSTLADSLCVPLSTSDYVTSDFKSECDVTNHNGPLAEGWEGNSQWTGKRAENFDGKISAINFGNWHKFASCLIEVMKLSEGQGEKYIIKIIVAVFFSKKNMLINVGKGRNEYFQHFKFLSCRNHRIFPGRMRGSFSKIYY
jgi:hypothetical protein